MAVAPPPAAVCPPAAPPPAPPAAPPAPAGLRAPPPAAAPGALALPRAAELPAADDMGALAAGALCDDRRGAPGIVHALTTITTAMMNPNAANGAPIRWPMSRRSVCGPG